MKPRFAVAVIMTLLGVALLVPPPAAAHCDTLGGPVVTAAKLALSTGDVTPVLKWVKQENEVEVRDAFARTLKVRALSPEARDMADKYFFETLVRIHRAGEGEPYTGLKDEVAIEPGIAAADKAITVGSAEQLVKSMSDEMTAAIRERLARVLETGRHANDNVAAGREYVAAYVQFIHYVEQLSETVSGPGHGHEPSQTAQAHQN